MTSIQAVKQEQTPLVVPRSTKANSYLVLKRLLDIVCALLFIIFTSPLTLAIAIGIKLFSQGPVFYRQTRIGKNGRPFSMLKFRSMQVHNNPDLHRVYVQKLIKENTTPRSLGVGSLKLKTDPRVTGLGKYLRRYSLDELPQFLNVLKGDMSIVGPRPSMPYEYECYSDWHKQRLAVLPGMTGLWQVKAHNTVCFDDMARLDLDYIRSMNLWLDLHIIFLTPFEMLRGKGTG